MKLNKKGFTIVELVIVIAVIAILAAVLIPTFSSVIEKANESAALQEGKAALDVLSMEEATANVTMASYTYYFVKGTTPKDTDPVCVYNGTGTDEANKLVVKQYKDVKTSCTGDPAYASTEKKTGDTVVTKKNTDFGEFKVYKVQKAS